MTQPHPPVPQPTRPDSPPAPATSATVWPAMPPEHQRQALLLLAQMLLKAHSPEVAHD